MKKKALKWMLSAAVFLVLSVLAVAGFGITLPEHHTAARTVVLSQSRDVIWETITDYAGAASWRPDLQTVESGTDAAGRQVWIEVDKAGDSIPYATLEEQKPSRLVREIADPELPFGGTWTFQLDPAEQGTRITITEDGFVPNPVVRVISTYLIGHTTFMESYLTALGEKFGERVEPLPVS